MLSFAEQLDITNRVYENRFDADYFKEYFTRGHDEENALNKEFIIGVFRNRILHYDNTPDYIELVKFYVNFFILHNDVYYKYKDLRPKPEKRELKTLDILCDATIYDKQTDTKIIDIERKNNVYKSVYFMPAINDYDEKLVKIEFNNFKHLEDINNIVLHEADKIKISDWKCVKGFSKLERILKADNVDEFAKLLEYSPGLLDYKFVLANESMLGVFELTIILNAMECFKYMIEHNVSFNVSGENVNLAVMLSRNDDFYEIVAQEKPELLRTSVLIYLGILFHKNNFVKQLLDNMETIDEEMIAEMMPTFVRTCLRYHNYDILVHLIESGFGGLMNVSFWNKPNYYKPNIIAILYIFEKYGIPLASNWIHIGEYLISLPIPVDRVLNILKRAPIDLGIRKHIIPLYISECFIHKKPREYIHQMITFLYENETIETLNVYSLLNYIYSEGKNINMLVFMETMMTETYNFNEEEYDNIVKMLRRYKEHRKEIQLLLTYYTQQLEKHNE